MLSTCITESKLHCLQRTRYGILLAVQLLENVPKQSCNSTACSNIASNTSLICAGSLTTRNFLIKFTLVNAISYLLSKWNVSFWPIGFKSFVCELTLTDSTWWSAWLVLSLMSRSSPDGSRGPCCVTPAPPGPSSLAIAQFRPVSEQFSEFITRRMSWN